MFRFHVRPFAPVVLLGLAAVASATPIKYTVYGVGSGSLNGTGFVEVAFSIVTIADTTNITGTFGDVLQVVTDKNLVTVTGLGSDLFTDTISSVVNQVDGLAGVSDVTTNHAILFAQNPPAFATYDLASDYGPITGDAEFNHSMSFATLGGSFVIDRMSVSNFVANTTAVPEPATFAVLGLGALAFRRRRPTKG